MYFIRIGCLIAICILASAEGYRMLSLKSNDSTVGVDNGVGKKLNPIQKKLESVTHGDECFPYECKYSYHWRSIDGSCNNEYFPQWGKSWTQFIRVIENRYPDGKHEFPQTTSGEKHKNIRECRKLLFPNKNEYSQNWTTAFFSIGQIIAHDTGFSQLKAPAGCCKGSVAEESDECCAIPFPDKEGKLGEGEYCSDVSRFQTACVGSSPQEQINGVTAFLDGSHVYGSDDKHAAALRAVEPELLGELESQLLSEGPAESFDFVGLFPPEEINRQEAMCKADAKRCLNCGEKRANQNYWLLTWQILFFREHNRIARILRTLWPKWSDERIYQEARRIVIAEFQHIAYDEWLPYVIGDYNMEKWKLKSAKREYSNLYDPDMHPNTMNEFGLGFRFFHDFIPDYVKYYKDGCEEEYEEKLSETFNKADGAVERYCGLVRGSWCQPAQKQDHHFADSLTDYYPEDNQPFPGDLISIDWMRFHDNGGPNYFSALEYCGLEINGTEFQNIAKYLGDENLSKLEQCFNSTYDIPLIVGLLLEYKNGSSVAGPVGTCLIAEQFQRWKFGDRWFWDYADNPSKFTPDQLATIWDVSLASIICENTCVEYVPKNMWIWGSPVSKCSEIPKLNLEYWNAENYPEGYEEYK